MFSYCAGGDGLVEKNAALRARCVLALSDVQMHMPATVGDYTGASICLCISLSLPLCLSLTLLCLSVCLPLCLSLSLFFFLCDYLSTIYRH
jgi:hypothetical protein